MVEITSIFLLSSVLIGCCGDPIVRTEIKEIYIPVKAECPSPRDIPKPDLPVNDLKQEDKDNYEKIAKQYAASLKICMSYAEEQETVLNSYKKEIKSGKKE